MDTRADELEQLPIRIVVLVDGSEPADWAFHKALQYKRCEDELMVCHVTGNTNMWSPGLRYGYLDRSDMEAFSKAQRQLGTTLCKAYVRHCHQHGIPRVGLCVISPQDIATPAQESVWYLEHHKVTDVFLGARGVAQANDPEMALGSFSDYVMRHAKGTVHVIKKPVYQPKPISPPQLAAINAQVAQQDPHFEHTKLSDPSSLFEPPQSSQVSSRQGLPQQASTRDQELQQQQQAPSTRYPEPSQQVAGSRGQGLPQQTSNPRIQEPQQAAGLRIQLPQQAETLEQELPQQAGGTRFQEQPPQQQSGPQAEPQARAHNLIEDRSWQEPYVIHSQEEVDENHLFNKRRPIATMAKRLIADHF